MRAVVLQGVRAVGVETVPDARLSGPRSAVVAVAHAAICGSDMHLYHGDIPALGVRLGHESVGTVVEVGAEVERIRVGDRVAVSGVVGCGQCVPCTTGDPVLCSASAMTVFGTTPALPGGQAEALTVPFADSFALALPEVVTDEQAVLLTDVLPTGYTAARRADIAPGSTVAVVGLGPVGIAALQCAALFGPARLLAVDTIPDRLARAADLGAEPVDATGGTGAAGVLELTGGRGADSVIEAVGLDQTIADAVCSAAPGGTVSIVGVSTSMEVPFPMVLALLRNLTVRATVAAIPRSWPTLLPLLVSGRLRPDGIVTHRLGLSEAPRAYRMFDERTDGVLKVVLDPSR